MLFAIGMGLMMQERKVEPTWLYRDVSTLAEQKIDLSSESCHYTAIFGEGDSEPKLPQSVARFGELTVAPHGTCQTVEYSTGRRVVFCSGRQWDAALWREVALADAE